MKHHRAILAWFVALLLGVALSAGGCANGSGDTSSGGGDDSGTVTDGTTPGDDSGDAATCTGGKIVCSGICTNPMNDPKNCGKCGNPCTGGKVCSGGMCGLMCGSGETLCNGSAGDAGAKDSGGGTPSDAGGDAATDAGGSPKDAGGGGTGDAGTTGPYCANTNNDPNNCGGCGIACPPNIQCMNGTCGSLTCPAGQKPCFANGQCIPNGTCCQSGECTISGEVCPMPGSTCQCPSGETECTANNQCIPKGTCCAASDCNMNGATGFTCPNPGQQCVCSKTDVAQCCTPTCSAANVGSYTCSTSNVCGIGMCKAGCYDLDNKYSDGCECCQSAYGHACGSPTNGGTLSVGQSATPFSGTIPTPTGEDWFVFTFTGEGNTAFHANIQLTTNPNNEFVIDVLSGSACGGTPMTCGDNGGNGATGITQFERSYSGPNPPADPANPTFSAIPTVGTVLVRVYRANTSAAATCDGYTLSVSE